MMNKFDSMLEITKENIMNELFLSNKIHKLKSALFRQKVENRIRKYLGNDFIDINKNNNWFLINNVKNDLLADSSFDNIENIRNKISRFNKEEEQAKYLFSPIRSSSGDLIQTEELGNVSILGQKYSNMYKNEKLNPNSDNTNDENLSSLVHNSLGCNKNNFLTMIPQKLLNANNINNNFNIKENRITIQNFNFSNISSRLRLKKLQEKEINNYTNYFNENNNYANTNNRAYNPGLENSNDLNYNFNILLDYEDRTSRNSFVSDCKSAFMPGHKNLESGEKLLEKIKQFKIKSAIKVENDSVSMFGDISKNKIKNNNNNNILLTRLISNNNSNTDSNISKANIYVNSLNAHNNNIFNASFLDPVFFNKINFAMNNETDKFNYNKNLNNSASDFFNNIKIENDLIDNIYGASSSKNADNSNNNPNIKSDNMVKIENCNNSCINNINNRNRKNAAEDPEIVFNGRKDHCSDEVFKLRKNLSLDLNLNKLNNNFDQADAKDFKESNEADINKQKLKSAALRILKNFYNIQNMYIETLLTEIMTQIENKHNETNNTANIAHASDITINNTPINAYNQVHSTSALNSDCFSMSKVYESANKNFYDIIDDVICRFYEKDQASTLIPSNPCEKDSDYYFKENSFQYNLAENK